MTFKVVTPVAVEPITTAEAKLQCKVDHSDDDTLIAALITTAREFGEHYTGRAFAPQTLEMALDAFPVAGFDLAMPPAASITHIKYTDTSGNEQTLDAADYSLSLYGDARTISPAYLTPWPLTQDIPNAVRIRYVAGYTTLPKAPRAAMLLLIGHLYENRAASGDVKLEEVPLGVRALLDTIKIWGK